MTRFRLHLTYHNPIPFCTSTEGPDYFVQNQPRSDLVLVGLVKFWIWSGGKLQCKKSSGPEIPARFQSRIQMGFKLDSVCLLGLYAL